MNNNKTLVFFFLLLFSMFSVCALFSPVWAGNSNIGFLLTDKTGKALLSENPNKPLIPASILKIVTSVAAISYLGEEYRYQTHFYYDYQSSNLFIKGFGDPLFISEKNKENPCFLCSRLRRKRLFEIAQELGCKKIALGHNKDDIIETFFINMFYAGKLGTMKPGQSFFNDKFQIIRPMSYIEKDKIIEFCSKSDIPEFINTCPSNSTSKRKAVREMLNNLYQENSHIKGNVFKAMGQVIDD